MAIPDCPPALPPLRRPSFILPQGAVDCHFHIFGPKPAYPYAAGRSYTPPDASVAQYEKLAATLGIARAVIVQPSVYGMDNRRTLDAIKESRLISRAVVVLDPGTPEAELDKLHGIGVRGVRINLLFKAGLALESAVALADEIRDLGWHLQFLADVSEIVDLPDLVRRLKVPVVFDHLGHMPISKGIQNRGFQNLLGLLRDGLAWVKISGAERTSALDAPPFDDIRPVLDALIGANPNRLVWGTDWPHPAIPKSVPEDAELLDAFGGWIDDDTISNLIFVDNPNQLYLF